MALILRSITHWTGGAGRASTVDRVHYHRITEFDGNIAKGNEEIADNIVTSDGDYAAHTLNLNTGSAGFAMAGMHGAKEVPYAPGPYPINEVQFEAHCQMLAEFHADYDILPITRQNCLTHAEVEPTLGVKQRGKWDLTRLPFRSDLRGALPVGGYMRERVRHYLGAVRQPVPTNRPTLRQGNRGLYVRELQDLLREAGHFSGKVDGVFGPRTKSAVLALQSRERIAADGIVGQMTWEALMDSEPMPPRDVSIGDLRNSGSQTIDAADKGQTVAAAGGAVATAAGVLEAATGATESLTEAQTALGLAQSLLTDYWPLLALLGASLVIWYYFSRIKTSRATDAQTGKHLGR